jgi:pimeloyl-ACP methyl ester carboxylesterase
MRAKLPHTTGYVDRAGVKLHYEIFGQGEHTIVFVPTWALVHSQCYKAQVPYFSEHFRVVTYDPRGNGKSDRPTTAAMYDRQLMVDDITAILDKTDTEKGILVGYSQSGANVCQFAADNPDRVEAFVTIGSTSPLAPAIEREVTTVPGEDGKPMGWAKDTPEYWRTDHADFARFFLNEVNSEPHSTKQLEDAVQWAMDSDGNTLALTAAAAPLVRLNEETYRKISCPNLIVHAMNDRICHVDGSRRVAELTGGELIVMDRGGHAPHGRLPAQFNILMRDFLAKHLGTHKTKRRKMNREKRALSLSSPIGLGHARRDLAVTRELRKIHPDLQVDWLAQDPVTRFLNDNKETIHPASNFLANESAHIEDECGEHDLHAFQAIRNMDEILIKNFMVFQEVLEDQHYDLVIADEAWDVDHYWHEHPEMKNAQIVWFTDFVGWLPFAENGPHEADLTADYNAEMIKHVEGHPQVRDRAIFVGGPEDIVDESFGAGLPQMRDWIPNHYEFADYIIGQHPSEFGPRDDLRAEFGYDDGRLTCIVSVGGSGVGISLVRRILAAYPIAKARIPALRMIVVTGPRLDPAMFDVPAGVEMRAFVPNLDRHLAACDLALVQGGLTTCMELAAAGTPFLYFPLRNHFEQNFHVASRLDRYGAGRKLIYAECDPEQIAEAMLAEINAPRIPKPVAADGAARAAVMLAELL